MSLNYKSLLLTAAFLTAAHCVFAADPWDGTSQKWTKGSGTQTDPYLIETPSNLAYLVRVGGYKGIYFLQTADFDINNQQLVDPAYTNKKNFYGNYDGGNHQIVNVASYLFGAVRDASIQNVTIAGSSTYSMIQTAQGNTTLTNCHNKSTAEISGAGLVVIAEKGCLSMYRCSNYAVIKSAYTYGETTTNWTKFRCAGGLVGKAHNIIAEYCANNANITHQQVVSGGYINNYVHCYLYVGGIVGCIDTIADISYSYNKGNIIGEYNCSGGSYVQQYTYCAGIVGYRVNTTKRSEIFSCFNSGNITSSDNAGGIATHLGIISKCYSRGKISSGGSSVDVVGIDRYSTITDCYFAGSSGKVGSETTKHLYYQVSNSAAIPKEEEFMKSSSFISLLNGVGDYFYPDYTNINDGYPILRWQLGDTPFYTIRGICKAEQGTVSGAGEYPQGAQVKLTATPKDNYTFVGWSDGDTDNPRTISVDKAATYVAQFDRLSYTVYVNQDCSITVE